MSFRVARFGSDGYARAAAGAIADSLPRGAGSVVLTGGTTAAHVYPHLASLAGDWSGMDVFFSDERCVPPDDERSNYRMATETLLDHVGMPNVHRMRGEDDPEGAAAAYDRAVTAAVERGFDLVLLGLGADCHIGAMFPGSDTIDERERLCVAVDRPDGLRGLTLTPPAMLAAKKIVLIVSGAAKAEAVARAGTSNEPPSQCSARLLADHDDVTFVLDDGAASEL